MELYADENFPLPVVEQLRRLGEGKQRRKARMHPEELFAAVRRRPFMPFRLHVSDGSSHDVRHPDSVLVSRRATVLGVPDDPTRPAERLVTVALVHVTRLEELAGTPAAGDGTVS